VLIKYNNNNNNNSNNNNNNNDNILDVSPLVLGFLSKSRRRDVTYD